MRDCSPSNGMSQGSKSMRTLEHSLTGEAVASHEWHSALLLDLSHESRILHPRISLVTITTTTTALLILLSLQSRQNFSQLRRRFQAAQLHFNHSRTPP